MADTPVPGPDDGSDRGGVRSAPPGPKTSLRTHVIEWVEFIRTLSVNLIIIICIVVSITLLTRELLREPVIIEEVSLPPSLVAQGYSGSVTAQRLWDAISDIQSKSQTHKVQTRLISADRQLDVAEPGTGISLQQLTQALRNTLNLPQTRIAGEVLCATPDCEVSEMRLRLRVFEGGRMHILDSDPIGTSSIDGYFHLSAQNVLEVIDPYVLAAYLYYYEFRHEDAVDIAEDLLRRRHPQSAWAANLIGNRFLDIGQPNAALPHYQRALRLSEEFGPEDFAVPRSNIGQALIELGDHQGAIDQLSEAIELDATDFESWRSLGQVLLAEGDAEGALDRFETAARLAPDDPDSWTVWGNALSTLGRHRDAFQKFHMAIDLNPLDTKPRRGWRRSLTVYIDNGPDRCAGAGRPVEEYLRVAGSGVPAAFREELLKLRAACGLPAPDAAEES